MSLSAAGYYLGADGGVTFNTVVAGKGYRNYKYDYRVGYKAEVPFLVTFNDYVGLESGVAIYGKNYRYSQKVEYDVRGTFSGRVEHISQVNFDYIIRNGFLSFPLSFRASLPIGDFSLFLSLGGYVGVWLYGGREGTAINQNDIEVKVKDNVDFSAYNRFDGGLRLRVGADYSFYSFRIYTAFEYLYSLADMNKKQRNGAYPIHNSTFSITLGILYRFNSESSALDAE